jgi:hypothetical protein
MLVRMVSRLINSIGGLLEGKRFSKSREYEHKQEQDLIRRLLGSYLRNGPRG